MLMAMVWFQLAVRLLGEFTDDFQLVNLCIILNSKLLSKRLIKRRIATDLYYYYGKNRLRSKNMLKLHVSYIKEQSKKYAFKIERILILSRPKLSFKEGEIMKKVDGMKNKTGLDVVHMLKILNLYIIILYTYLYHTSFRYLCHQFLQYFILHQL